MILNIVPRPGFCFKKYHEDNTMTLTMKVTTPIDNPDLIESYTLTPQGEFTIVPVENAYGQTNFEVYAQDEEFAASDTAIYSLTKIYENETFCIDNNNFYLFIKGYCT